MDQLQYLKNLTPPAGPIDIILDTDAYNEIDDQFAISYMVKQPEKFRVKGICAAPFLNQKSVSPADGMEKSYDEILKLLSFMGKEDMKSLVFRAAGIIWQMKPPPQSLRQRISWQKPPKATQRITRSISWLSVPSPMWPPPF